MDPLSDVLSQLKIQSSLSARLKARGDWAIRFPSYRHIKFGGVLEGAFWLWIEGSSERIKLEAGDFYLLTNGKPYCCATDVTRPCVDGHVVFSTAKDSDGIVHYGSGDPVASAVGGRFEFSDMTSQLLLGQLPPLIHLRAASRPNRALRAAIDLLIDETETTRPGSLVMAGSIANLILVQILRAYLLTSSQPASWLHALTDARIGAAIALIHSDPAKTWRVEALASAAAMSRTSFMQRFKALVGQPPLDYLIYWRMMLACTHLQEGVNSLSQIAETVGYTSSSAFSLAFKRTLGQSPGSFRAAHCQRLAPLE